MELRDKIEALLFASGRKMELKELGKLCGTRNVQHVKEALLALQQEYTNRETGLKIVEEGDSWKLSVKDSFSPLTRSIVTETELTKSVMETLAVIAWKNPALQADIIHIRTNKAYDHLELLEEAGYISRTKWGRTRKIALTERFFSYFDLPNQQEAQAEFKKYIPDDVRKKIESAETEIIAKEKVIDEDQLKRRLYEEKQKQLKIYEDIAESLPSPSSAQPSP